MFLQRALITFTVGPLALYLVYLGGWFYFVPISAILLLAAYEYVHMFRQNSWHMSGWVMGTAVFALLITSQWFDPQLMAPVLVIGLLAAMSYPLILYERRQSQTTLSDWMAMMGGVLLIGWVGGHFFLLRRVPSMPWQWTMIALLSTWFADSGAYVVGKYMAGIFIGRHKLSPRLSPNKTIEGYVGGIFLGILVTLAVAKFMSLPLNLAFAIALFASMISPLGDLAISMIKREVGVKDSGNLFPGHGGALDRIDSLMWTVTAAYYLVLFMS
jgi:phosphatidate cytidylyltransferase